MRPEGVSEAVWRRFRRPRHAGCLNQAWRHGRGGAVKTGALIELWLRVEDERILEACFQAFGCPATIAAGDWLCEWLTGRRVDQARELSGLSIAEALELPAVKRAVALVAEDALKAALAREPAPGNSNK